MTNIHEQIELLRMIEMLDSGVFALTQDNCKELADTLERLLAVVEAAKKQLKMIKGYDKSLDLIKALKALDPG